MVQWELQQHVQEAQQKQPTETDAVVVQVERDGSYPKYNDHQESSFRDFVPLDDRSFGKPIQVVVGVSECDETGELDAEGVIEDVEFIDLAKWDLTQIHHQVHVEAFESFGIAADGPFGGGVAQIARGDQ